MKEKEKIVIEIVEESLDDLVLDLDEFEEGAESTEESLVGGDE